MGSRRRGKYGQGGKIQRKPEAVRKEKEIMGREGKKKVGKVRQGRGSEKRREREGKNVRGGKLGEVTESTRKRKIRRRMEKYKKKGKVWDGRRSAERNPH